MCIRDSSVTEDPSTNERTVHLVSIPDRIDDEDRFAFVSLHRDFEGREYEALNALLTHVFTARITPGASMDKRVLGPIHREIFDPNILSIKTGLQAGLFPLASA